MPSPRIHTADHQRIKRLLEVQLGNPLPSHVLKYLPSHLKPLFPFVNAADHARIQAILDEQWPIPLPEKVRKLLPQHLKQFLEIECDSPNLIWLYALMVEQGIELSHGEVVSAMKCRLLREGNLPARAWRYLANGSSSDFRIILDCEANDEENASAWRWKKLICWLEVLSALKLTKPLSEPAQQLFYNDSLLVLHERDEIHFMGAWMKVGVLRHILLEVENREGAKTLQEFVSNDLVDVVTWLSVDDPSLEKSQINRGWKYLIRRARQWRMEISTRHAIEGLHWISQISRVEFGSYIVEAVTDAWSLRHVGVSQRNCVYRFLNGCLEGTDRIFIVRDFCGRIVATFRLALSDEEQLEYWEFVEARGFANSRPAAAIIDYANQIARKYTTKHARMAARVSEAYFA